MFRKHIGVSEHLYTTKRFLYLKTDRDNFNYSICKDMQASILRHVQDAQPLKLILDLKAVSKLDSASIGVLIHVRAECKKINCDVVLLNVNETINKIFELLHLPMFFILIKSLDELENL